MDRNRVSGALVGAGMGGLLVILLVAFLALAGPARAGSCAEEAELLAREYGLVGAGTTAPPEERSNRPGLESAPSPEARSPAESEGSSQSPPLDPTRRARMEAALSAARAAPDEQQCFRLLEEARSASPGKAPEQ